MPVGRPSTNSPARRKAGSKRKVTEIGDRHHTLWCPSFFDANRLWSITFLNLEAVGKTGLGDHDSPAEGSVL